jgi:hypothetical protein
MASPSFWYFLIALFVLAGAINLARGFRRTDAKRRLSIGLGLSSLVWAVSAALIRFVEPAAGYVAAALATAIMVGASLFGTKPE